MYLQKKMQEISRFIFCKCLIMGGVETDMLFFDHLTHKIRFSILLSNVAKLKLCKNKSMSLCLR